MINRRGFLRMIGAGVAGVVAGCAGMPRGDQQSDRPLNVVLIVVDDMGWTDVACFGSQYYETPNIDRLCAQGMKFTSGYAACAVCSPTRAAIMTGRYPTRLGITDWIRPKPKKGQTSGASQPEYEDTGKSLLCPMNHYELKHEEVTIAELLKKAGYATGHIGKWHLGTEGWWPEDQGFDVNVGGCDFGHPPSYFEPYESKAQGAIPNLKARKPGEYLTDREAEEAIQFIRENKDRPFFLNMWHYAVHTPVQGKPELVDKYRRKTRTQQKNPTYAAMVQSVDEAVGGILSALEEAGITDRTVVIFTSDNGGLLGPTHNAPLLAGKGYPYEGGIRVPLIVKWPGVTKAGSVSDVPVTSVDYLPTLCAAAGVRPPQDRPIDGVSLLPTLQGRPLHRDAIYWHFPHYRGEDVVPYSIIRRGSWKLIKRYEGKTFELFNLNEDLAEKVDLSETNPGKVKELDTQLTAWLQRTGAKMPKRKA